MTQKNKITVYLLRDHIKQFKDAIDDETVIVHEMGEDAEFCYQDSYQKTPSWVSTFFLNQLPSDAVLKLASVRAVFLRRVELEKGVSRIFAIPFGQGRHLLESNAIEDRFGLKTALNSIDEDSIRSLEKTALGSILKQSREQISKPGDAGSFGVDYEQDLLRGITGQSKIPDFGKAVTASDGISLSVEFDQSNIDGLLVSLYERYTSNDYKENFEWVDHLSGVKNSEQTDALNEKLIERLEKRELENVWLAPPDIIEWDNILGFRYHKKRNELLDDLRVPEFLESISNETLDLDLLKKRKVLAYSADREEIIHRWQTFKCIYAEIDIDDQLFILNNGQWFEVDKSFAAKVSREFSAFKEPDLTFVEYNKDQHINEGGYNTELAKSWPGAACMDAKNVMFGGGKSRIEFCDVFTSQNQLVHVKKYSGSAQLSHLFFQGLVSSELFLQEPEFRKKLNDKLPNGRKLADINIRPEPKDYEVVYAIISESKSDLNIPFFSKVSLRNARRRLEGFGFNVTLKKIEVAI